MQSEINLFRLRVFVEVVDRDGYSAAASHLGVSQPSVSYHIGVLERVFETELVSFRGRSLHLTAEGETLYRAARLMLREGERLEESIRLVRQGRVGRLDLGASIAFEHGFFFDEVIGPFVRAHPDIEMSLRFGHSIGLVDRVLERELDLAYVNDWNLPPTVRYEPLHRAEVVFLVAPDHPLAGRERVEPADIARAGVIAAPADDVELSRFFEVFRAAGIGQPRFALEVDGVQARKLATEAGLGVFITFLPAYAAPDAMAPLRRLPVDMRPPDLQFGLVARDDEPASALMEEFGGWLRRATTRRAE